VGFEDSLAAFDFGRLGDCITSRQLPVLTSRQALLLQNTPVAKRFNDFLHNFGASSDLMVVLEGAPLNELQSFANELSTKLQAEPEIGQATSRLDMTFFLNHAYLIWRRCHC
jgi:predicted RND superfamily exporter protein